MTTRFEFWVGNPPMRISAADRQWFSPLPMSRAAAAGAHPVDADDITYGDYFTAARNFLASDHMAVPLRALERHPDTGVTPPEPRRIRIHLAKHGALYHPARVTLTTDPTPVALVLNVAVSAAGRRLLTEEVAHLAHLHRGFAKAYVPQVYGAGEGATDHRGTLPMFAGQWFDGYHELHCATAEAGDASAPPIQWCVWDSDRGRRRLSRRQTHHFFRAASFILTYYFDPRTLHAIMDWHHAAGDFIIRQTGDDGIDVRLITVRRYTPMIQMEPPEQPDLGMLLDALALLFLRTSLWMRLDRLDGIGELVWAGNDLLAPVWRGFVQGLREMARMHDLPQAFVDGAVHYLAAHGSRGLERLGHRLLERLPPDAPEAALIERHLGPHITHMAAIMRG